MRVIVRSVYQTYDKASLNAPERTGGGTMWTNEIDYLARDRQAELLRLAADIHLGLAAQAGRERKIGDKLRETLRGLLRGFSVVAIVRRFVDRAGAQVASGSVRS